MDTGQQMLVLFLPFYFVPLFILICLLDSLFLFFLRIGGHRVTNQASAVESEDSDKEEGNQSKEKDGGC